jgi:hypothetical protein
LLGESSQVIALQSETSMRHFTLAAFAFLALNPPRPAVRANMLHIRVSAPHPTRLRAIWHAGSGVRGATVAEQQRRFLDPLGGRPPVDSLRRWHDSVARDTVNVSTPVQFVVDMNDGPVRLEVPGGETVEVEAQLSPARGPLARARGHAFIIEADGRAPTVQPRP